MQTFKEWCLACIAACRAYMVRVGLWCAAVIGLLTLLIAFVFGIHLLRS